MASGLYQQLVAADPGMSDMTSVMVWLASVMVWAGTLALGRQMRCMIAVALDAHKSCLTAARAASDIGYRCRNLMCIRCTCANRQVCTNLASVAV